MRALVCCLSMALTLTGCELLQQLSDDDTEPQLPVAESSPHDPHALRRRSAERLPAA